MRILITGATGLVGSEIIKQCHENNITINYLTSKASKLKPDSNYKGFLWNPLKNEIDEKCIEGVDAIMHLVGASISKRWTSSYKETILQSRLQSTQLLLKVLKNNKHSVKQIISASAIGIYPSSLTNYYKEDETEKSNSFLGKVVSKWEDAVDEFKSINILVSKVRIGLVLSSKGGALPEIVKPIKYGVGAAFGSGKQWQSWIHVKDLAKLFLFIYKNKLEGVYNGVAPNPETNKELTTLAAKVIEKPLLLPNIPKLAMQIILGEMHVLLFESQRVSSSKIESEGFKFEFYNLKKTLYDLM